MAQEQERPATPEKQLLNLIEDPKAVQAARGKLGRRPLSLFSLDGLRGRLDFFKDRFKAGVSFKKLTLDLHTGNTILFWGIVLLVIYLAWSMTVSIQDLENVPDFAAENARTSSTVPSVTEHGRKIDAYLGLVRDRDLFSFGGMPPVIAPPTPSEVPEVAAPNASDQFASSLQLVGIGWSADPDAMIEDMDTKKIYFLKRGDWIDGKIKVKTILIDRVILSYNDKEIELR